MEQFSISFPAYLVALDQEPAADGLSYFNRFALFLVEDGSREYNSLAVFRSAEAAKLFIAAHPEEPQTVFLVPMKDKSDLWKAIRHHEGIDPPLEGVQLDPVFADGDFPPIVWPLDDVLRFLEVEPGAEGEAPK